MNATRQGVQVNILGSNGATVGQPMFIPANQSRQGGQVTHVSPPDAFYMASIGPAREVRFSYLQSKASQTMVMFSVAVGLTNVSVQKRAKRPAVNVISIILPLFVQLLCALQL